MSELTPRQQEQVEWLFARALEAEPGDRDAVLGASCNDPAVRSEVESLLAARPAADRIFEGSIADSRLMAEALHDLQPNGDDASAIDDIPEQVGPYRILSKLGEGGMGTVYLADQTEPIRRRVALKLIKPGMDTRAVMRRFEAERQALALMNHPNVARVLEAGATPQGRPYFVMEHVEGERITRFCDRGRLDVASRLRLFMRVCHGVQHAHQKGIIHRDIKPSNVLVSQDNGTALPRVIDFGVAKATGSRLNDETLHTEPSALIGTPEYMSPEQASRSTDIDTRTDIYALGVLLYELLVGALPLDTDSKGRGSVEDVQRLVREREPLKPSTRLSSLGARAKDVAVQRGTDRSSLRRKLRGELDWLVMKCLEKDRDRRYATVAELIDDIERYLAHRPIVAGPPSIAYQARKFVRRHRAGVMAGAAVICVLIAGIVSTTIFAARESQQRAAAETQTEIAEAAYRFLNEMLVSVDPRERGPDVTVRQVLDQAATRVEVEFTEHPAVERSVRSSIGRAFQALGLYENAHPHLERALGLTVELHGEHDPATATSMNELGVLLRGLGRFDEAESLHRRALAIHLSRFGEAHVQTAESMNHLAQALYDQGKYDEGRPYYLRSFAVRSELLGAGEHGFIAGLNNLARAHYTDGDYAKAEEQLREALRLMRDLHGDDHPDTVGQMNNVAFMAMTRGRFAEAEALFREALGRYRDLHGEAHPDIARTLNNLGESLRRQQKTEDAEAIHREALAIRRRTLGENHPDVATSLNNLGLTLTALQRYAEAQHHHRESLALRRAALGEEHPRVATSLTNLAFTLFKQGEHEDARALFEEGLALRRRVYGDAHPQVANTQVNLARCLAALDDVARAESLCREALRVQREALGENHPETTATQIELGRILVQAGKYSEAESVLAPLVVMPHPLRIESYVTHQGWLPAARRREWPNGHAAETAELLRELYERRQVVEKHK